ncbi:DUF3025 domain-containing protein [Pseudoduganella albidiflava]|uniref:DUF3025 domain-containing protein n=1 Tax=Pseudoduganella albidiflava TaxID=321983 RepID=A0A411X6U2_9BURK|nr:DUF3025 domain-containing protein [Pseudoduganella albidiflava]QBI04727.1 DUF3025 domain-containing protein [Pseudoduganella albidiflava]GGY44253.1 hypothetical protein GCM10007387_27710 [Pseudoduganella albidiflava]
MLPAVDWSRPWYDAVRAAAGAVDPRDVIGTFSARAAALELVNHAGLPIRFVPQAALPEGTAYEEHIGATGCVPTRDNLHDFFNGLVWLSFPLIKRELNALQAAQIARDGIRGERGPARDAATLFDENAALLVVPDTAPGHALADALRNHRWREAFVARAGAFGSEAQVWLFGHALMEKLVAPYKAITAHTLVVAAPASWFALPRNAQQAWLDAHLAERLRTTGLRKADFTPLPVLGIPGWWGGQDDAFYDDTTVFRAKRNAPTLEKP